MMIYGFNEIFSDVTKLGKKIPSNQYLKQGKYSIIDQGKENIAGYTNDEKGLFTDVPAIIFGDHTRVLKFVDEPCFLGADGVKLLKSKHQEWNDKYLFYALKDVRIPDTGYNRHFKWLKQASVLVPSREEQDFIVTVLDTIENVILNRKNELEKLDELVKSRFIEMFGDPLNRTGKWPLQKLENVAIAIDPQPSHRTPSMVPNGIPYVSIKDCDIKTGKIHYENARRVDIGVLEEHKKRYQLKNGDFIIGKIGTIGEPIFISPKQDYVLSANVVLIQPIIGSVYPHFLKYSFESAFVERQFEDSKHSTSQAAFGIQKVRNIQIMNPEIDMQKKFEDFSIATDKSKLAVQKSLDELEMLKKSLMQQYFG